MLKDPWTRPLDPQDKAKQYLGYQENPLRDT